jgi:hypothetical protein
MLGQALGIYCRKQLIFGGIWFDYALKGFEHQVCARLAAAAMSEPPAHAGGRYFCEQT